MRGENFIFPLSTFNFPLLALRYSKCFVVVRIDKIRVIVYNNYIRRCGGMTFKEVEKILKRDGWYLESIRGSHCKYKHPTKVGTVIVPNHKGDIPKGTLYSIFKQAGLK